jgi:hypothetical protein
MQLEIWVNFSWSKTADILKDSLQAIEITKYKILSLTYTSLKIGQPFYLRSLLSFPSHRSTRSSSLITLSRPSLTSRLKIGNRSFGHSAPVLWNNLPSELRHRPSCGRHRKRVLDFMLLMNCLYSTMKSGGWLNEANYSTTSPSVFVMISYPSLRIIFNATVLVSMNKPTERI